MLKSNINGNEMFNNANESIFNQDLSRLHHKKSRGQTVENVKYAVNSQISCASAGVQRDPPQKKIQKIIPHISYLKKHTLAKMECSNIRLFSVKCTGLYFKVRDDDLSSKQGVIMFVESSILGNPPLFYCLAPPPRAVVNTYKYRTYTYHI